MPRIDRDWLESNTTLPDLVDDRECVGHGQPPGSGASATDGAEAGVEVTIPARTLSRRLMVFVLILGALVALGYLTDVIELHDATSHAVSGSEFNNRATVYVFRSDSHAGKNLPLDISLDGITSGSIRRKQYLVFPVTRGVHRISAGCPSGCGIPTIRFDADYVSGRTYYFLIDSSFLYGRHQMIVGSNVQQLEGGPAHFLLRTYKAGKRDGGG